METRKKYIGKNLDQALLLKKNHLDDTTSILYYSQTVTIPNLSQIFEMIFLHDWRCSPYLLYYTVSHLEVSLGIQCFSNHYIIKCKFTTLAFKISIIWSQSTFSTLIPIIPNHIFCILSDPSSKCTLFHAILYL